LEIETIFNVKLSLAALDITIDYFKKREFTFVSICRYFKAFKAFNFKECIRTVLGDIGFYFTCTNCDKIEVAFLNSSIFTFETTWYLAFQ